MTVLELFKAVLEHLQDTGADKALVDFIDSRIEQEEKSRAKAKEKRASQPRKKAENSPFYSELREVLSAGLTDEPQTGQELVEATGAKTTKDTPVLAPQVATALKPLVESGEVIVESVKRKYEKDGLKKEVMRKAYRLA